MKETTPHQTMLIGLFAICVFGLASIFVYLGLIGWPGLHWDAALYGTPVINVARGKGWLFGSYGYWITQRDSLSFHFHGILHVFVYGVLFKSDTWVRYLFAQGAINAASFTSYTLIYAFLLAKLYGSRIQIFLTALLLGSITGVLCLGLQGRPEQLAPLALCIPLTAFLFMSRGTSQAIALGASMGVLTILSPLVGLFFAVLLLFYWFATCEGGISAYIRVASLGVGTALFGSSLLLWSLTPFSPLTWYSNAFGMNKVAYNFQGLLLMFRDFIWGRTLIAPGWSLLTILLLVVGTVWLWRCKRSLASMLLVAIAFAFFNEKMADYSYVSFIPFAIALCLAKGDAVLHAGPSGRSLKLIKGAVLFAASAYMFVLIAYLAVAVTVPRTELSIGDAQLRFNNSAAGRDFKSGSSAVGFPNIGSPSMVILGDGSMNFASFNLNTQPSPSDISLAQYEEKTGNKVNWMIYPQVVHKYHEKPPSEIFVGTSKYRLTNNYWVRPSPIDNRVIPSHLSNRYNFAIYRRQS
jgi:hypothetical protein